MTLPLPQAVRANQTVLPRNPHPPRRNPPTQPISPLHQFLTTTLADPDLYDTLVRQFQTPAEREAEGRAKGYSRVLEGSLLRGEARLERLAAAAASHGALEALAPPRRRRRRQLQHRYGQRQWREKTKTEKKKKARASSWTWWTWTSRRRRQTRLRDSGDGRTTCGTGSCAAETMISSMHLSMGMMSTMFWRGGTRRMRGLMMRIPGGRAIVGVVTVEHARGPEGRRVFRTFDLLFRDVYWEMAGC